MATPNTVEELRAEIARARILRLAADCLTFNVGGSDIDAAEELVARGELRRWCGKRDRTFTYAITKKGRAALAETP